MEERIRQLREQASLFMTQKGIITNDETKPFVVDLLASFALHLEEVERQIFDHELVIDVVAEHFGITVNQLLSKGRAGILPFAKRHLVWLLRHNTKMHRTIDIARVMGTTHATAIHHMNVFEAELKTYAEERKTNLEILNKLIDATKNQS